MTAALAALIPWLVHIAGTVQVLGFLLRSQIPLRLMILAGDVLFLLYYWLFPAEPLWGAMLWSGAMISANAAMVGVLLHDRRAHGISDEALHVYGAFGGMVPGDFRRLMRHARLHRHAAAVTLTRLDEVPERLYFVIEGDLTIARRDRTIGFPAKGLFIAEIGFLLGTPASATVTLAPCARYVEWDRAALMKLFARNPAIRHAVERALGRDLAAKLARDAAADRAAQG